MKILRRICHTNRGNEKGGLRGTVTKDTTITEGADLHYHRDIATETVKVIALLDTIAEVEAGAPVAIDHPTMEVRRAEKLYWRGCHWI